MSSLMWRLLNTVFTDTEFLRDYREYIQYGARILILSYQWNTCGGTVITEWQT